MRFFAMDLISMVTILMVRSKEDCEQYSSSLENEL